MLAEQAATELGPNTFYYFPLSPPNFHGDQYYAVTVAEQILNYTNGLTALCKKAPDRCKTLPSVVAHFQDLPDTRSCTTGDLIFRTNAKTGVSTIMVTSTGFVNLRRGGS